MKKTIIAAALGLLTVVTTAAAQPPGWGYGPGYGAGYGQGRPAIDQPAARPARGPGGRFCHKGARDPAERIARRLERMSAALKLNEEQKMQIKAILEEQHAKRIAQRQETHNRILATLDEGQRAQAQQFMSQGCQGRRGRFGPGRGPGWDRGPGTGNNLGQFQAPATAN